MRPTEGVNLTSEFFLFFYNYKHHTTIAHGCLFTSRYPTLNIGEINMNRLLVLPSGVSNQWSDSWNILLMLLSSWVDGCGVVWERWYSQRLSHRRPTCRPMSSLRGNADYPLYTHPYYPRNIIIITIIMMIIIRNEVNGVNKVSTVSSRSYRTSFFCAENFCSIRLFSQGINSNKT